MKNGFTLIELLVIATMLGRAKNQPNKTKDMNDAIIVFKKWMENYKANKK